MSSGLSRTTIEQVKQLLDLYVDDLKFVHQRGGRLLYFVDAVELISFVDPRIEDIPHGFRLLGALDRDDAELLALSDHVLSRFLFGCVHRSYSCRHITQRSIPGSSACIAIGRAGWCEIFRSCCVRRSDSSGRNFRICSSGAATYSI